MKICKFQPNNGGDPFWAWVLKEDPAHGWLIASQYESSTFGPGLSGSWVLSANTSIIAEMILR